MAFTAEQTTVCGYKNHNGHYLAVALLDNSTKKIYKQIKAYLEFR